MNFISKVVASALLAAVSSATVAAPATSEKQAVKATELRQSMFQLIASNMGPLGAMARGKMSMDATLVEKNATRINQLAHMIEDYMAVDTRKYNVKTEAKNDVWKNTADFSKKIDALLAASSNLQKAAKSGNSGAIKAAIGGVGKSCKGCHDSYKVD